MPFEATYGFLLTLALMIGLVILGARLRSGQTGVGEHVVEELARKEGASA